MFSFQIFKFYKSTLTHWRTYREASMKQIEVVRSLTSNKIAARQFHHFKTQRRRHSLLFLGIYWRRICMRACFIGVPNRRLPSAPLYLGITSQHGNRRNISPNVCNTKTRFCDFASSISIYTKTCMVGKVHCFFLGLPSHFNIETKIEEPESLIT